MCGHQQSRHGQQEQRVARIGRHDQDRNGDHWRPQFPNHRKRSHDMPVVHASKFELVINKQTARMLRLTVSPSLLAAAGEAIE